MIVLEYLTIWTYLEVAVYVSLYRKLFSILAKNLDHPTFRKKWSISRGTAVGIANLIVSGLFGLGASLSGFSILFLRLNNYQQNGAPKSEGKVSEKTNPGSLGIREDLVTRAMLASIAYFIYDLWAMYKVFTLKNRDLKSSSNGDSTNSKLVTNPLVRFYEDLVSYLKGRPLMIVHHIVMAFVFIPLILIRRDHEPGDMLISCTFLLETSTPFVALRTILSDLKVNSSVLYLINGILMLVVFFFCRIAIYPFFYYVYGLTAGLNFVKAVMKTPWYCALGMAVSFLPQVYWFKLMFKGAIKMVRSRDGPAQMNEIKKQN